MNEISLALKTLGYKPVSPDECWVETEVMPTIPQLWKQRNRWQRGAIDNLRNYGWTKTTRPYILRQLLAVLSALALTGYLSYMGLVLASGHKLVFTSLSVLLFSIFITERVVTVRRVGLTGMAIAATLVVELAYDCFQNAVMAVSLLKSCRRTKLNW